MGIDSRSRRRQAGLPFSVMQLDRDGRTYAALPKLHDVLGDAWAAYRFLVTPHAALDGRTGLDALIRGRHRDHCCPSSTFPDPLGCGKAPSRFSAPAGVTRQGGLASPPEIELFVTNVALKNDWLSSRPISSRPIKWNVGSLRLPFVKFLRRDRHGCFVELASTFRQGVTDHLARFPREGLTVC